MKKMYLLLALVTGLASCQKEDSLTAIPDSKTSQESTVRVGQADFRTWYTGLESSTVRELQSARAATARYQNLNNALADGYADISVDVENMGHHYMKTSLLDNTFDMTQPEILVYNRTEDGRPYLVAVEYAIPIDQPEPSGFTGTNDVWNPSQAFQLWLLHAWVWEYNPDGVFNPTNPDVHMH